ncbi:nitroreductase [Chitinophaga agrisoli]|uniref:Nitroreductase n=1 Tax=Chitinophaga agrisoli TaxID=2607653 RepID=A0A5B2VRU9_9BACT|nr:nitroreductase family protein [Chitinophaga agrisoli]KAA2242473.1 nitroreductase [Chitinophaga agrisoli]
MQNIIATTAPVHPLLLQRWSPKAFQESPVPAATLSSLFEAARLAPSCHNEQPWHFIVATKDTPLYQQLLQCFNEDNQAWAFTAPVLMVAVAKMYFDHNGAPNPFAWHDVGLAVANLTVQAVSEGLQVCEAAGIDLEHIYEIFDIPEGYQPVTGIALGYAGDADGLPAPLQAKHHRTRTRKPVNSFVHYGQPAFKMELNEQQQQVYNLVREKISFGDLRPAFAFAQQRLKR